MSGSEAPHQTHQPQKELPFSIRGNLVQVASFKSTPGSFWATYKETRALGFRRAPADFVVLCSYKLGVGGTVFWATANWYFRGALFLLFWFSRDQKKGKPPILRGGFPKKGRTLTVICADWSLCAQLNPQPLTWLRPRPRPVVQAQPS